MYKCLSYGVHSVAYTSLRPASSLCCPRPERRLHCNERARPLCLATADTVTGAGAGAAGLQDLPSSKVIVCRGRRRSSGPALDSGDPASVYLSTLRQSHWYDQALPPLPKTDLVGGGEVLGVALASRLTESAREASSPRVPQFPWRRRPRGGAGVTVGGGPLGALPLQPSLASKQAGSGLACSCREALQRVRRHPPSQRRSCRLVLVPAGGWWVGVGQTAVMKPESTDSSPMPSAFRVRVRLYNSTGPHPRPEESRRSRESLRLKLLAAALVMAMPRVLRNPRQRWRSQHGVSTEKLDIRVSAQGKSSLSKSSRLDEGQLESASALKQPPLTFPLRYLCRQQRGLLRRSSTLELQRLPSGRNQERHVGSSGPDPAAAGISRPTPPPACLGRPPGR